MTAECFNACYNLEKLAVNRTCFETCYQKYLLTIRTVYQSLKEYGYKTQSLYAYKAFPEHDEWFEIIYSSLFSSGGHRSGIKLEHEAYNKRRF